MVDIIRHQAPCRLLLGRQEAPFWLYLHGGSLVAGRQREREGDNRKLKFFFNLFLRLSPDSFSLYLNILGPVTFMSLHIPGRWLCNVNGIFVLFTGWLSRWRIKLFLLRLLYRVVKSFQIQNIVQLFWRLKSPNTHWCYSNQHSWIVYRLLTCT